jgi:uncharacterized protein YwqG
MNKEYLEIKLIEAGLSRISNQVLSLTKSSIRFITTKSSDTNIPLGASKIGGCPDLPLSYSFPEWNSVPLAFLAQINLVDISGFNTIPELPSSGILSFFYSATQETWGYDPKHKGSWQIYYFTDLNDMQRTKFPENLPAEGHYAACSISFFEEMTLPPFRSLLIEDLNLDLDERKKYVHFEDTFDEQDRNGMKNRLLGHPDAIQGDMRLECQLVSNGLYCGDSTGYNDPRRKELEPDTVNWELLLQLDSEEETAKMMWGDVGRVYFWIHKAALAKREFEKAWFQLQCY